MTGEPARSPRTLLDFVDVRPDPLLPQDRIVTVMPPHRHDDGSITQAIALTDPRTGITGYMQTIVRMDDETEARRRAAMLDPRANLAAAFAYMQRKRVAAPWRTWRP